MAQIKSVGKNRHQVRIYAGRDGKGRKLYPSRTITGTPADARKFAREWERKRDLGALASDQRLTVGAHLDGWLKRKKHKVRLTTLDSYTRMVKHLKSGLGIVKLSQLQSITIENFYADMLESGKGVPLVRYLHSILSGALKEAKRLRMIGENPMLDVSKPARVEKQAQSMNHAQAYAFRQVLDLTDADDLVLAFALYTGMRPEEYLGERWTDLELDSVKPRAHVRQTAVINSNSNGWYVGKPKTLAGLREVYIPRWLAEALRHHRTRQLAEKMEAGRHYEDHGLVFATRVGTPIRRTNLTDRSFRPALKRAGLPHFRLYDLRHTWFTLSIKAGGDLKAISQQGGHKDIKTTLSTYHHVLEGMQEEAAARLEMLLSTPPDTLETQSNMRVGAK